MNKVLGVIFGVVAVVVLTSILDMAGVDRSFALICGSVAGLFVVALA